MSDPPIALGPGREFDLVRSLVQAWGPAARGIGDDGALIDVPPGEHLVVSTDTSVEGVHFRRAWMTPAEIGYRATAAALSDLAAMAAHPLGLVLSMTLPRHWRADAVALAEGVGECARLNGTPIVGGDTTSGSELSLTVTVLGSAAHPLRRSGAQPGDTVYVTGRLGAARAALQRLLADQQPDSDHRARFVAPIPRLAEAAWLAARGATSAVDVSDGLVADLAHVAAASGVRMVLDLDRIPLARGVDVRAAASSGEEYELALTAPNLLDVSRFEVEFGIPLTSIGQVRAVSADGPGLSCTIAGAFVDLAHGYDHFT